MQKTSPKTEALIESGIDSLRSEHAKRIPADGILAAIDARSERKPVALRTGLVATACAIALLAIFLSAPRDSAAAGLQRSIGAMSAANTWVQTMFAVEDDGSRTQIRRQVVSPNLVILESEDAATYIWERGTTTNVFDGYAYKWRTGGASRQISTAQTHLERAVPSSIKRTEGFVYNGSKRTKYEFTAVTIDGNGREIRNEIMMIADSRSSLPLFIDTKPEGQQRLQVEYQYDLKPRDLAYALPDRVYDLDRQRDQIIRLMSAPRKTVNVAGREIALHAVIVDEQGNIDVLYSGSGRAWTETLDTEAVSRLTFMRYESGWAEPVSFGGLEFSLVRLSGLNEDSVRVPVYDGVQQAPVGWAKFKNASVMRTASNLQLLAPQNTPFFFDGGADPGQRTDGQ